MLPPGERRIELKFPLTRAQHGQLLGALFQLNIPLRRTYAPRTVHSIYVDDCNLESYEENWAGIGLRLKRRFRWYGQQTQSMQFELKRRLGVASEKSVVLFDNPEQIVPDTRSRAGHLMTRSAATNRRPLDGRFPIVHVAYRREYFETDARLRVTLDTEIRHQRLYPLRSSAWQRSPVWAVLELKCPEALQDQLPSLLGPLPILRIRHSKYIVAVSQFS
jgi:hypothetical protein